MQETGLHGEKHRNPQDGPVHLAWRAPSPDLDQNDNDKGLELRDYLLPLTLWKIILRKGWEELSPMYPKY